VDSCDSADGATAHTIRDVRLITLDSCDPSRAPLPTQQPIYKRNEAPESSHSCATGLLQSPTGLLRCRATTNQGVMDVIPWTLVSILIESQIVFLIVLQHKSPSGRRLNIRADLASI
jgi:hypothetical protein